jgi:hypothetical protein
METEDASETLAFNSTLTRLIVEILAHLFAMKASNFK